MSATISNASIPRISFNELVSGSEGVRYADVDGAPHMSVRDIIMVVCGQNNKRASETWVNIDESKKNELSEFLGNFKFEGRGQSEQPVITLQGALKLIMWLPGTMAKEFRSQACDILTRYLAGDQSLHAEVNANAQSQQPINEFARASLPEPSRDALIEQLAPLVPIVKRLTDEMAVLRTDRDRERHMRHQADGRYGSEVREANKNVREQAEHWKKLAESAGANISDLLRRNSEKDQMILECHRVLFRNRDDRSRSPPRRLP
jgi:hypothetical protein